MTLSDRLSVLPVKDRNDLETLLMSFDQSWSDDSLVKFVDQLDQSQQSSAFRLVALKELVKIDIQRCWTSGGKKFLEDYLEQFPKLGTAETVDPDLILMEYTARKPFEQSLSLESYSTRYPRQHDQLVQLVKEIEESSQGAREVPASRPDQASIETSRIANTNETTISPQKPRPAEMPVEFGRYRILRELGAGAMGTVYLAHDTVLDRQVALKTPSFQAENTDEMVTRFYREAKAAAKIQHRNICPIFDVGELDGQHFITMAFVKGRTMSELIQPDKLPPAKTSAILVHRLALALSEAHRHNVIHRDLKPANIMIDRKREPVVMDFGLARQTDIESRMTQSGMLLGTPAYMSPEQLSGGTDDVGEQSDIYALGVILYELLCGKLPFNGSLAQVVCQILQEEPQPPSESNESVPMELESICAKMMAKDRSVRFQTMSEVATAIRSFLTSPETDQPAGDPAEHEQATTRPEKNKPAPSESEDEPVSETGVLNEYFAAQAAADPLQTAMESIPNSPAIPMALPVDSPFGETGGKSFVPVARKPKSRRKPSFWVRNAHWVAAGFLGLVVLVASIVFFVVTPYGTLRVETFGDLDGLEVLVDGDAVSLNDNQPAKARGHSLELKLGGARLNLDPATHEFRFVENGTEKALAVTIGDTTLTSESFTVERNGQTVIRIKLLSDEQPNQLSNDSRVQQSLPVTNDPDNPAGRDGNAGRETVSEMLPVGRWVRLLENERQLKASVSDQLWREWERTEEGPPRIVGGTVMLKSGARAGRPLYGRRLSPSIRTRATRYLLHVRHNKVNGFGMAEGIQFENQGVSVTHFDKNKHEMWIHPNGGKVNSYRSPAGSGRYADLVYVVIDGKYTAYLNGKRMYSGSVPNKPPTGIWLSVRRAYGHWRDVAMMQLSDQQVDAIRRGELPTYHSRANESISTSSSPTGPDTANDPQPPVKVTPGSGTPAKSIFNGADLAGWEVLGHNGWSVRNGVLVGKTPGSKSLFDSWLMRGGEFENFELEFQYRLESGGNSGIFFRADRNCNRKNTSQLYEVQLLDDTTEHYANLPQNQRNGALWKRVPATVSLKLGPNQWHRMKIRVRGNQLDVWSNDQPIASGKFPKVSSAGKRIAIQLHTGQIEFKNLEIKQLGPADSNTDQLSESSPSAVDKTSANESRSEPAQTESAAPRLIKVSAKADARIMALSPDGLRFATTGTDTPGQVTIRDSRTGDQVNRFVLNKSGGFGGLTYSVDGKSLIFSIGRTVHVADCNSGKVSKSFEFPSGVNFRVFPKRNWAAALFHIRPPSKAEFKSGNVPQSIRIWDLDSGKTLAEQNISVGKAASGTARFLAISPDEKFVTFGLRHNHVRYEIVEQDNTLSIANETWLEQTSLVRGPLVFSNDGRFAATTLKKKAALFAVLDFQTGRVLRMFDRERASDAGTGSRLAFTPDGRRIVASDHQGGLSLWDVETGELLERIYSHEEELAKFGPPGILVSASGRLISGGGTRDRNIVISQLPAQSN